MQKLLEKGCLTTFLKSTKDSLDDQNSVPVGTKQEKNQPLKLFYEKNNSNCLTNVIHVSHKDKKETTLLVKNSN